MTTKVLDRKTIKNGIPKRKIFENQILVYTEFGIESQDSSVKRSHPKGRIK